MAIGFSLPGIPGQIRGTAEEAGAVPDLGQAMMQGFRSNLENIQGAPRLLAQKLVSNQLANTINKAKADYAQRMAQTGYEQALADLQNRNLINQYYPRMRESELKSAGLSQAHQQMVNQFYPDLIKSQLSGQGLTQEHQRMVNEIMKRQIDRQKRYDELLEQYRQQGATPEVAHQLAVESVNETHPMPTQEPKQISEQPQKPVDLMELLSGKQMPDYLSEMAPAEQTLPEVLGQNVPYSAMEQPEIGLRYTPFGINKQQIAGRESPLHKLIRQNYEQRDAALNAAFGSPMKFGLEQQLQNYLLNKTAAPPKTSIDAEAQGYQNITPLQAPKLQRQEALAQAFQLPPIPQEAPDYLQRPEEPAIAATEAETEAETAPVKESAPQAPQSYVEKLQQAGYNTANANPIYAAEDQFYLQRPDYRDLLKQRFPNIGVKQYNDFPRNRIITTETLPSGATKTEIQSLGGAQGGAPDFKASSPFGKANEDLKHYVETGDLESAKYMKQYIDNLLNKEGKTQTNFDKAYNEWQKAVQEFGPNSPKAQKYGERLQSLTRGNQTIQLNKGFPITNPQTGEQGYAFPQDKDEKLISGGRAAFNYIYPIIEEGVRPFSGTILETTTALANAVNKQSVDPNAAKQLEDFLLADKIRQSGGVKELRLIGGGMFKKTLDNITSTLANDQVQADLKKFATKNLINRDIQIRVNQRFQDILNAMSDREIKARSEYVAIYPSEVTLKDNMTRGLKNSANKSNQLKSKPAEPEVIVVTPEMVKGL